MTRLLALILDALDVDNLRMFEMPHLQERYAESGDIFTCATRPHTAESNPMIWGGIENNHRYWVEPENESVEGIHGRTQKDDGYVDPAMFFDRSKGSPVEGASGFSREDDYANESFIWDDLAVAGYDARALQVPVTLPPFSTANVTDTLSKSWFPDTQERQHDHIRKKPELIRDQFEDGAEFLATSIQMPDKWLHGIGEGEVTEEWVLSEAPVLDEQVSDLLDYCEENGIEWAVFGDHGSPAPGAMMVRGGEYALPRHRKQSIIISSDGIEPPTYSDEMYEWVLDVYGAESVGKQVVPGWDEGATDSQAVEDRLEALGYK